MGFSSQAIIMGLIKQIYSIDFSINQLYSRKFRIAKFAQFVGSREATAHGGSDRQLQKVRVLNFAREEVDWSHTHQVNARRDGGEYVNTDRIEGDPDRPRDPGKPLWDASQPHTYVQRQINPDGRIIAQATDGIAKDPSTGLDLEAGYVLMSKAEALANFDVQKKGLSNKESEIDQQLEQLKAQRTALNGQREEYTKYIGEGVKMTFKNNYA